MRIWLPIVLALSLLAPANAEDELTDFKSPAGFWSMKVPASWKRQDPKKDPRHAEMVGFVDPTHPKFAFQVTIIEANMSLDLLVLSAQQPFKKGGQAIEGESAIDLNGCPARRYEAVVSGAKGTLRVVQVIVDGGARKAVITVGLPEPAPDAMRGLVEKVVATFALERTESLALDLSAREFPEAGLSIDLPKGDGLVEEAPDQIQIIWAQHGVILQVDWKRTRASLDEAFRFAIEGQECEEGKPAPVVDSKEQVTVGGSQGILARMRAVLEGKCLFTIRTLYLPTGKDEMVTLALGRMGEASNDEMRPLEEALLRARVSQHFAAPAKALQPLSLTVQAWGDAARLPVPDGWASYAPEKPRRDRAEPQIAAIGAWAAEGAADLGVYTECGTVEGGKDAYEGWLRKSHANRISAPKFSEPKLIDVGGRPGSIWTIEIGPASDRRIHREVVVFEGAKYHAIRCVNPVWLDDVYGPLAEAVAAKAQWK